MPFLLEDLVLEDLLLFVVVVEYLLCPKEWEDLKLNRELLLFFNNTLWFNRSLLCKDQINFSTRLLASKYNCESKGWDEKNLLEIKLKLATANKGSINNIINTTMNKNNICKCEKINYVFWNYEHNWNLRKNR